MLTEAELFANSLVNDPPFQPKVRQVHRTIKLWEPNSQEIETLVSNTGLYRNDVMNRLIAIGIQELKHSLGANVIEFFGCNDADHAQRVFQDATRDEDQSQ